MGLGDLIPDDWEQAVEDGVENIGDGIEEAGDWSADRLEDAGWDGGADWVREKSRSAANTLGAEVAELRLGQTDDPAKLVYGSPSALRATASHLTDFKTAFDNVGNGLKGVKKGSLRGQAADAFEEKIGLEPKKWFAAADACEKASGALTDFAGTVEWAQGRAREALAKWDADEKDAAEEILSGARSQRNEAASRARSAVQAARGAAPPKPTYEEQVVDGLVGMQLNATHALGGVVKGTAGLVNFVRSVNVLDPYNLTHPAEYLTNLNSTATGLLRAANDPVGTGKRMWDAFQKDPAEGFGRLIPELLGTKGLGAVAKAGRLARLADDMPTGRGKLDGDGPDQSSRNGDETKSEGSDPVDLATGRMYLPQTDITLPGAMPLTFTRRVESGYRLGRWFGPSWSSTVDQRLEIDAEGVVFVAEDGRLLSYAHPAPGVPTLPKAGSARMPLESTVDGGYTLTDPDTGWTRHFSPPAGGAEVDGDARIEQITDRAGHHIAFDYDESGAPVRIVHSGGYQLTFTLAGGRVTALHLAGAAADGSDQTVMRYGYTDGHLTEVVDSSGLPLRFAYDEEARVVSWTDSNDRRYDYVYDNRDRCIAEGGTEGHMQVRIDYDGVDEATGYQVTTLTTASGEATRHLFDDRYQTVGRIDPLGNRTRTERDAYNRPLSQTDALGRTTGFTYDENGRLSQVTRPDGTSVRVSRNALGLPVSTTGPDGATWRQEWDEHGNRTATTDPAGNTTRFTHDRRGHLAAVTDALGETTQVVCDAAGLPVEITDPLGAVTRYERDPYGRPVTLTDPLGAVTRLEWTVEGQLARRTGPDGAVQTWTYDGEGNCTRHTDAAGGVTTYEYTHFDLLAAQTGPDGVRYAFSHDAGLRLTRVANPQGLTWDYTYDPAGRLISETDFDDRVRTYTHDAAGRLLTRTDPLGEEVSFTRDELGQVVAKTTGEAVTTYAYDPAGRLTEALGPRTELRYQRDKLGRIKSEMVNGRVLAHTYDRLGRRTRRVTPTGAVSTFTFDAAGNRTSVTAGGHTLDFSHDAAGRETTRRIGDAGLALTHLWDPAGRLTAQSLTAQAPTGAAADVPDVVQQRSYAYRADGYLTGIDDHLAGRTAFDLDAAGRVTAVHARGWSETYAYDEAGNQTHASWPTSHAAPEATGARTYTGTRITTAGRVRYEHDDAGRVTLRQKTRLSKKPDTWRYTWDAEDRLIGVTTPDGTVWRYLYDPMGRRTAKQRLTGGGEVAERVDFTWDGATLIEQTTAAPELRHPVTLTWDHDGFTPLAQTERLTDEATQTEIDSRFFAIVTDLVGTPSELVDPAGDIAWRTRTTLWGTTTWNTGSTAYTPLRFPGQYYDPETGLHYNFHRYYDPTTARYTTPDPLGLTPAPNPSTYPHNPHLVTDVLGLAPDCGNSPPTHKELPSRSAAFREAKRDLEIPMSLQPDSVQRVMMTDKFGNPVLDGNSQPIMTREYLYTREDGSRVIIQDHAAGHQFGEGGVGDQGRHLNVRPFENPRTGKVDGTAQHYEY